MTSGLSRAWRARGLTMAMAFVLGSGLIIGAQALGDSPPADPSIEKLIALFNVEMQPFVRTSCIGSDGDEYLEFQTVAEGTARSDDPRIGIGKKFRGIIRGLLNTSTGLGIASDEWQISDRLTGHVILTGSARATLQRGGQVKGLTLGRFVATGEHLIAVGSWAVVPIALAFENLDSPAIATLGSDVPVNPSDGALRVRGSCTDEFDNFFWNWRP